MLPSLPDREVGTRELVISELNSPSGYPAGRHPAAQAGHFPHEVVKANVRGDSLIKAWREYKNMTQADLAARAGIKQPALVRMEKLGANLRKSSLVKLADAMGLTVEQLIE